jgi:uncharacterized protein YjiS (DUF1127 family)
MMTAHSVSRSGQPAGGAYGRNLGRHAADFAVRLFDCLEVMRQRRQLLAMNDHELKDIGLSRADAQREGQRGFWDLPDYMS